MLPPAVDRRVCIQYAKRAVSRRQRGGIVRRFGWVGVLLVVLMIAAGCGSGKKVGGEITPGSTTPPTADACKTTQLTASEDGVSSTTITVTLVADTGSPVRPGVCQASVDAVEAWAKDVSA